MSAKDLFPGASRRRFLATTAAAAAAAGFRLRAQGGSPRAQYTRISLTDPGAPAMLGSYATAITALLKLSPSDPRNFYRNAFVHTLDCPHGNWWFLPWHRGYLGWWEQTVRSLSGNPGFAFPYWDWTAQPFVPDAFWQGVLNPSASEFIASWSDFQAQLEPAMTAFYASLTPAQQAQLAARSSPGQDFTTAAGLFALAQSMFFPPSEARSLTPSDPNFDAPTKTAVSLPTIQAALANTAFTGADGGFGSDIASQHSQGVGFGILEGQPHNNVHNDVGGFMGDFLSPVDPIFMAHHANIDRLWWVWTAKQEAAGLPTLPEGEELAQWQKEPFLFYVDSQGKPVQQDTAGDYATIGQFDYTYTKGSGDTAARRRAAAPAAATKRVTGSLRAADLDFVKAAVAEVALPASTIEATGGEGGPELYARVTIQPPADPRGVRFHVLVNPPEDAFSLDFDHASYAGTFEFFGRPHHHERPVAFTVALRDSVARLMRARTLRASDRLRIHVVPQTRGVTLRSLPKSSVTKIEVGSL